MFDIQSITMIIEPGDDITRVTVRPEELYPAIIARIHEVLQGSNPSELLATAERGGTARAEVLLHNARSVPETAWKDALRPRSVFINLPYFAFVQRNGGVKQEMLEALNQELRLPVESMIARGYALEIAMGWFCHALRLVVGAYDLTIEKNEDYQL